MELKEAIEIVKNTETWQYPRYDKEIEALQTLISFCELANQAHSEILAWLVGRVDVEQLERIIYKTTITKQHNHISGKEISIEQQKEIAQSIQDHILGREE